VLTSSEVRARKVLAKEVARELRSRVKGTGWKTADGWLFRQDEEWFVEARCGVWVGQVRCSIDMHMKPMALDPVFWEIVDTANNVNEPLSLRMRGAWTCGTPAWSETVVDENELDAAGIASAFVSLASSELARSREQRGLKGFAQRIEERSRGREQQPYLATLVCTSILLGDLAAAKETCVRAQEAGLSGGFQVGSNSFVGLALHWLARHTH
jgi:hypothetical protein